MPTQEERLATLERQFTELQQQAAEHIRELDENTTILLGVIRHQGQDIRRIFERFTTLETRLDEHAKDIAQLEITLNRMETTLDQHTALLTQILERLPGQP